MKRFLRLPGRPAGRTSTRAVPERTDGRVDRSPDPESGQVLVIFVGGLITIILFVGLVIDGGFAFLNRRDAQNVADTAALAGTKVVADHYQAGPLTTVTSATVYAAIDAIVQANGCLASGSPPCTWTAIFVDRRENPLGPVVNEPSGLPPNTQGVAVTVTKTPRTFFLGVIGQTSWNVGAGATALAGRLTSVPAGILLPIGTNPPQPFEPGREYVLTETGNQPGGGSSPDFGPGNFGWLSWTGSNSAGALAQAICFPNNPAFSFPADFPGDPGATNANDVRACLDKWIGQTVLIPVVSGCDPCNGNNAEFTITGAAAFTLTGYDETGPAVTTLSGVFTEYYGLPSVSAGIGGPPQPGDPQLFLGLVR